MTHQPSLRELFEGFTGGSQDPHATLEAAGYGDLEPHLVDEAIANYAHGAPVEVAEHLSPFVVSHSGIPQGNEGHAPSADTADGLAMLSSAPVGTDSGSDHHDPDHDVHHDGLGVDQLDAQHTSAISLSPHDTLDHSVQPAHEDAQGHTGHADLLFGAGEPGTADHVAAADAGHELPEADLNDAAPHTTADHGPGWIDVTGMGDGQPGFDVQGGHDDWAQAHHGQVSDPATGHEGLADHHDTGGALDADA